MTRWERFRELAAAARSEPVPPLDVTARVLAALREPDRPKEPWLAWLAMTGASLASAGILLAWAVEGWVSLTDPLSVWFASLLVVLQ